MPPIDDEDDDRPRSRNRDDHDDEDDDRPRRRRRRDDDDDFDRKPKKSGGSGLIILLVVGGIIAVLGCGGVVVYFLFAGVTKVREAASRAQEQNNMKQISLGMHNHASMNGGSPPRADDNNLAWRVYLLPYVEQDSLFRQFDLSQPWNQGRNQNHATVNIPVYQSKLDEPPTPQTHYRVFTGPDTVFDTKLWKQAPFPNYVVDGTSNTILLIDTAETVPWPQPKEVPFSPNGSFPEFGHPKRSQVLVATCDGAVRAFDKKTMDPKTLRALITANGGEDIGDW